MTKFGLKEYYKPTPHNLRRLGDGLLALALTISGAGAVTESKALTITFLFVAGIGKFLTNFFSEE